MHQHVRCSIIGQRQHSASICTQKIAQDIGLDNFVAEAETWFQLWSNRGFITNNLDFIDMINEAKFFPSVCKIICIAMALPVSTCSVERSFSTLRRVKTWLRSTMIEDRLNGLCMMSVHRDMINKDKAQFIQNVVDEYVREPRYVQFLFKE